jgi:hypothetical protein
MGTEEQPLKDGTTSRMSIRLTMEVISEDELTSRAVTGLTVTHFSAAATPSIWSETACIFPERSLILDVCSRIADTKSASCCTMSKSVMISSRIESAAPGYEGSSDTRLSRPLTIQVIGSDIRDSISASTKMGCRTGGGRRIQPERGSGRESRFRFQFFHAPTPWQILYAA